MNSCKILPETGVGTTNTCLYQQGLAHSCPIKRQQECLQNRFFFKKKSGLFNRTWFHIGFKIAIVPNNTNMFCTLSTAAAQNKLNWGRKDGSHRSHPAFLAELLFHCSAMLDCGELGRGPCLLPGCFLRKCNGGYFRQKREFVLLTSSYSMFDCRTATDRKSMKKYVNFVW